MHCSNCWPHGEHGRGSRRGVNAVTPSTNDINTTNGWANVEQVSKGVGTTELQFNSTRGFVSCFEYRTDGDTSQILSTNSGTTTTRRH